MQNIIQTRFRGVFWTLVVVLAVVIFFLGILLWSDILYVSIGAPVLVLTAVGFLIYDSYIVVAADEAIAFEILGKKVILVRPGFYIFVPSRFCKEKVSSPMPYRKDIRAKLFANQLLELSETTSAMVEGYYIFRIIDPERATYGVDDYKSAVASIMDRAFTHLMANSVQAEIAAKQKERKESSDEEIEVQSADDLDLANRSKGRINIANFFTGEIKEGAFSSDPFGIRQRMLDEWGIEIREVGVSDFILSEDLIKIRQQKLKARVDLDIENINLRKSRVTAKIHTNEGEGLGNKVNRLAEKAGLSPEGASSFITEQTKWGAIQESSNAEVVVFEGGDPKIAKEGFAHGLAANKARRPIEVKKNIKKGDNNASTQKNDNSEPAAAE
jgi:regulator of protease activity HflC (stomatin/prohibitin superfamily)